MLEVTQQRLWDNFSKQSKESQSLHHCQLMSLSGALARCTTNGHARAADFHCQLILQAIANHFYSILRPKILATTEMVGWRLQIWGQIHKQFYDMSYNIFRRMTKSLIHWTFKIILWTQNVTNISLMSYDNWWRGKSIEKTTLFTQNTMQKMRNCIDADFVTSNKSKGLTNHILGPLKLYIYQRQSTQCTPRTLHPTCRTYSHNYFASDFMFAYILNDWMFQLAAVSYLLMMTVAILTSSYWWKTHHKILWVLTAIFVNLPVTCRKIILQHHNLCHRMIMWHTLG